MGPDPIPGNYAFLPGSDRYEVARDLSVTEESLLVFIDTTTPERTLSVSGFSGRPSVNIDHHGDNSRFARVNLVDPLAGATAELAWEILRMMGGSLAPDEAIGLYAGLVTDTGRFSYSCTTPRSHRIASDLLERGIRPELMDLLLYCNLTPQALRLRGRAFSRLDYDPDRGIAFTWLSKSDFEETGADFSETEGLSSDLLRIRDSQFSALLVENNSSVRVSLRSRGKISAAEVAHRNGGGGHPNAAGMRLPLPLEEAIDFFREEMREFHG
jgi:phosphoesterase RecJ-like protein